MNFEYGTVQSGVAAIFGTNVDVYMHYTSYAGITGTWTNLTNPIDWPGLASVKAGAS